MVQMLNLNTKKSLALRKMLMDRPIIDSQQESSANKKEAEAYRDKLLIADTSQ